MDENIYRIEYETVGPITFRKEYYKEYTNDLIPTAKKHIVTDDLPNWMSENIKDCVIFDICCTYTGIHYHSIYIIVVKDGVIKMTVHSVGGDGTLCDPSYDAFLTSRIKYYEKLKVPIYIHKSILTPNKFHSKHACRQWKKYYHFNNFIQNKNINLN